MKKIILTLSACVILALASCSNEKQCENKNTVPKNISEMNCKTDSATMEAIRKPLDLYVKAAVEGDSNVARPAFIKEATITHVENDSIICLPIQNLFDYYDETGKQPASYEIMECSIAGDIAMVRIKSVFGETRFTDMFTLACTGEEWKIVSKIFTVE